MLNQLARPLASLLLLAAPLACTASDPVVEQSCRGEVCLLSASDVQAFTVAEPVEACVPAEPETYENDPSGLAIAGVSLAEDGAALLIELVNDNPLGVYSYPGTRLRVVEGDARVLPASYYPGEPATEASWQLYGIEGCGAHEHDYGVVWGEDGVARFEAEAFDSLGEVVIDTVSFVLTRP